MVTERQKANLKPFNKTNRDRSVRNAIKGGVKSGISRRRKKTFKEVIEYCLNLDTPKDIKEKLKATFPQINEKDLNLQFAMVLSMINMTFKNNNNVVSLFQALRDTIGEKPVEKQETKLSGVIRMNDLSKVSDETLKEMAKNAEIDIEED